MNIHPFIKDGLSQRFQEIKSAISKDIDAFTNDEILANDIELLTENLVEKYRLFPIKIFEEDKTQRENEFKKIRIRIPPALRRDRYSEYAFVDGVITTFAFPFNGDGSLFYYKAISIISSAPYKEIDLARTYIMLSYETPIDKFSLDDLLRVVETDIDNIKKGTEYVNADCIGFNESLPGLILHELSRKKENVKKYYQINSMLEIPLIKVSNSGSIIPMKRRIKPIEHKYKDEDAYYINESDYLDILGIIRHTCSTYERTPSSCASLHEEDLRNFLLASLNGMYQGTASGETFRKNGKTDICIEYKNRAAFIAECKIWQGQKGMLDAIDQLLGYLTWRDCKTALILFSKNKGFIRLIESLPQALKSHPNYRYCKGINKNEFECSLDSTVNPGQIVRARVLIFDLST